MHAPFYAIGYNLILCTINIRLLTRIFMLEENIEEVCTSAPLEAQAGQLIAIELHGSRSLQA